MKNNSTKNMKKLRLQAVAFLLIVLSSFGLYFAVASGITPAIRLLMTLIAAAMVLAATSS